MYIFRAYVPNKTEDWKLAQLISSLQFIRPNHLDIKALVHPELIEDCSDSTDIMILLALFSNSDVFFFKVLTQINFYVIPKNKLNCISGCCLTIFSKCQKFVANNNDCLVPYWSKTFQIRIPWGVTSAKCKQSSRIGWRLFAYFSVHNYQVQPAQSNFQYEVSLILYILEYTFVLTIDRSAILKITRPQKI